jgi:hypothetical protein
MIFASGLILEHEPLQWQQLPYVIIYWLQTAGMYASLAIFLWFLVRMLQRERTPFVSMRLSPLFTGAILVSWAGTAFIWLVFLGNVVGLGFLASWQPGALVSGHGWSIGDIVLTVSGGLALGIVIAPVVSDFFNRLRWGRIWAMARLSLKEAVRNRAVLVFAAMALVFLFADWFVPYKAEDQVRNYVRVVYWSMTPLFLLTAGLLGSFSIPNDVKSQSIHTIVTKPVEKFEIVLGRFLGYALLLSAGLAFLSGLSLLYVMQGVNENAQEESLKARVPIFGYLGFHGTKGDSVGREWDYRRYIAGPRTRGEDQPIQYAFWKFADLPSDLGTRAEPVRFEYTFDIFRLSKGEENKDIPCTFTFAPAALSIPDVVALGTKVANEYRNVEKAAKERRDKVPPTSKDYPQALEEFRQTCEKGKLELMKQHRFFQRSGVPVTDYHTQAVEVPPEFFKAVLDAHQPVPDGTPPHVMQVIVNIDRLAESQMLGVAGRDLYLLAAEKPFWQNFLKGIVGMWCTFMLVLGIAVALSTYLSGVITWVCTMFLFCAGLFTDYLQQIATRRLYGGGPSEAAYRLFANRPIGAPITESAAAGLIKGVDAFFSWWVGLFLSLIPDINRYDLHQYVANGFDIGWTSVLIVDNLLPLAGYLLPWAVLAYYLMKYREIANPM